MEGFIEYLRSRADRADDLVDYGFLKVQTDVYRVRQLVLGTTEATRLAVSPTLAGIAKAETAVASKEELTAFFQRLRETGGDGAAGGGSGAAFSGMLLNFAGGGSAAGRILEDSGGGGGGEPVVSTGFVRGGFGSVVERQGTTDLFFASAKPSAADVVAGQTVSQPFLKATTYTPSDITNATPLVGNYEIRTLSLAERLQPPKGQEARDYSTDSRHKTVLGLVRLADELTAADGEIPGLFDDIDVWGLADEEFLPEAPDGDEPAAPVLRRPLRDFLAVEGRGTLLRALLKVLADRTVALLRQVEGRVHLYRQAIAACEEARTGLQADVKELGVRERAWSEVLGEARHDVSVARALIDEEVARLDAINARRAAILEKEVRFLAYTRPRAAENLAEAPSRPLDPGLLEAPVPACLRETGELPDELRDMLEVVREAPADWFRLRRGLLDGLDRVDHLLDAVRTAQRRTLRDQEKGPLRIAAGGGLPAAIGKVRKVQHERLSLVRRRSLQMDVARLKSLSWRGIRAEAAKVVSLGDLIEGGHGRSAVARDAGAFFERFGRVTGCLHAAFSEVTPSIRLDWAEILSEFDEAPNLRSLATLPRWAEIEYEDRRRLQALADWIFDQLDPTEAAAKGLADDVVRMCILLASHAPVGRIIAGRLPRPVTARPGLRIPLLPLDPGTVRVGMQAVVYRAGAIVARAVVEDVGTGEASARVTYTSRTSVELDETVRVHFAQAAALSMGGPGFGGI